MDDFINILYMMLYISNAILVCKGIAGFKPIGNKYPYLSTIILFLVGFSLSYFGFEYLPFPFTTWFILWFPFMGFVAKRNKPSSSTDIDIKREFLGIPSYTSEKMKLNIETYWNSSFVLSTLIGPLVSFVI